MEIKITYCGQWNYEPQASSLAAEIAKKFRIEPTLIVGGGGIFDVEVDGDVIFSKHKEGRFPEASEVLSKITAGT